MTQENVNGWTNETLLAFLSAIMDERDRRYAEKFEETNLRYEDKFIAKGEATEIAVVSSEKATKIAMDAAEKALVLASEAAERRFATIDFLRTTVEEKAGTYVTRPEYQSQHQALTDSLNNHILDEQDKNRVQEEKQDSKLEDVKERLDAMNKWILGLMGGVVVALVLTIVDLLVRGLSK